MNEIVMVATPTLTLFVGYYVGRRAERGAWVWTSFPRHERRRGSAGASWN